MTKPKLTKLPNGLRIVTLPLKDNPTVTVMAMVETGARYETPDINGLSHFLEHMCFKGTEKRTGLQIIYELEAMGAETNAFTDYDYTGYYAKGQAHLFPKLLDVVSDVYQHSVFPPAELEKERGVICGEIDMIEDNPMHKIGYTFVESLYGDQAAGKTIIGPKSVIKSLTRDDFIKYHNTHYIAEKTVIVVVGNIDSAKVVSEVKKAFKTIRTGKKVAKKKISKTSGPRMLVQEKPTDQSHLIYGLRAVPLGHSDYSALKVATAVLGSGMSSRLFIKLREEMGAGYYVSADLSATDDAGEFAVSTGTEPKRVEEVVSAIWGEIERLRTEEISPDELSKVKEYLVGRTYMGLESTNALAYSLGLKAVFGQPLTLPRDVEKQIRSVTAEDVRRVAKKYFKKDAFHLAVIGPHGDVSGIEQVIS